jgi:hypothetical protein
MMWMQVAMQFIATVLFIGGMYLIFDRKRAQRIPDNPGARLQTYARIAVQAVERLYPNNPSKKDLAIAYVADLYKEWKLPVPSKATIELAIESETFLLSKM